MRKTFVILIVFILLQGLAVAGEVSLSRQVQNLTAFTKLCGYVKHFYPADEAADFPWAKFQAYGAEKVINAQNNEELRTIMLELFTPVVPTLQLYTGKKDKAYDLAKLIPENPTAYSTTFWQYRGLKLSPNSVYQSIRARRPFKIPVNKEQPNTEAIMNLVLPCLESSFSKARISFSLMKPSSDSLKVYYGVYYGPQAVNDSLEVSGWKRRTYLLEGLQVQDLDCSLYFTDFETIFLDSLKCEVMVDGAWQTIYDNDFSDSMPGTPPKHLNTNCMRMSNYVTANTDQVVEALNAKKVLAIRKAAPDASFTTGYLNKIFEEESQLGELVDEPLIKGLSCRFPLALYANNEHTYPRADTLKLRWLQEKLQPIDLADKVSIYNHLSGLTTYWNHLCFFYPYWQYTKVDWERELPKTIEKILTEPDFTAFKATLRELISKTLDGHASLSGRDEHYLIPGFKVDKVEGRWIVTGVVDDSLHLPLGLEVGTIDGLPFTRFMKSQRKYFTKATTQGTDSYLFISAMMAYPDSMAVFGFRTPDGNTITKEVKFGPYQSELSYSRPEKTARYTGDIWYVNIGLINEEEILQMMPELAKAKGIIFDLRDYPNIFINFIANLLTTPDKLETMYKKCYLYPRRELPRNQQHKPTGWYQEPAEPHLGGKIVFLCGANSISRTESFLQNFKYNKLGTIIGQPTAGVTGNVIGTSIAGEIALWWTGMFVENPDGSRFHGVGVIPDIYVKPSIKAFTEGRDAEMERSLLYLQDELKLEELPRLLE